MLGGDGGGETEGGGATSIMAGIGQDDKASSGGVGAGEVFEGDRSSGGNRWPRQETIALLKIRSDMDVVFRDSSLKGPLWEEVSRKMAELGYHRSAKKCKEKFENVYKYHKRTKEGRVGKSDGKTYRFFAELEALEQHQQQQLQQHHLSLPPIPPRQQPVAADAVPVTMLMPAGSTVPSSPHPISVVHVNPHHHHQQQHFHINVPAQPMPVVHSSSIQMGNSTPSSPEGTASPSPSLSSSSTSSDEEILGGQRKRKRKWKDFFEKLMKDVVDKQEELQKRFLEVVEKREHDRLVRDEAWKMQEMARLNRERELLVQERSMAAAKDAALISFLQKLSDQQQVPFPLPVQIQDQIKTKTQINSQPSGSPQVVPTATTNQSNCSQPPPSQPSPLSQPQPSARVEENLVSVAQSPQPLNQFPPQQPPPPATQLAMVVSPTNNIISTISTTNMEVQKTNGNGENHNNNFLTGASSSRWPKAEIEALINLRSNLDQKYQENGPKGPLWEEISAAMKKIGYNRNAKRCKEKWENINKYFKKVKESNKKRPDDSKTCPYFHQLDALYREKKLMEITATTITNTTTTTPTTTAINNTSYHQVVTPITMQPEQQWPLQHHDNNDSENTEDDDGEDDEEDEHGNGYEIVANNAGGSMGPTTSIATTTA